VERRLRRLAYKERESRREEKRKKRRMRVGMRSGRKVTASERRTAVGRSHNSDHSISISCPSARQAPTEVILHARSPKIRHITRCCLSLEYSGSRDRRRVWRSGPCLPSFRSPPSLLLLAGIQDCCLTLKATRLITQLRLMISQWHSQLFQDHPALVRQSQLYARRALLKLKTPQWGFKN
jgi:hypothetical protein